MGLSGTRMHFGVGASLPMYRKVLHHKLCCRGCLSGTTHIYREAGISEPGHSSCEGVAQVTWMKTTMLLEDASCRCDAALGFVNSAKAPDHGAGRARKGFTARGTFKSYLHLGVSVHRHRMHRG